MQNYLQTKLAEHWAWWCHVNNLGDQPAPSVESALDHLLARPDHATLEAQVQAWQAGDHTGWCLAAEIWEWFHTL